jgi:HSP20 family protein
MLSRFLSNRSDLTRSDDPFQQLQREIGRVVEDVFRGVPPSFRGPPGMAGFAPSLDVKETPQGLELAAELPGVKEEDIELSLEGEVLTLRGEKREERRSEERGAHIQERSYGSFQRSLRLPYAPDPGGVSANFDKGVLHVTLPRPAQQAQRDNRIPIRGGATPGGAGGQASGQGGASGGGQALQTTG